MENESGTGAESDGREALAVLAEFERALDRGDFETAASLCLDDLTFFGSGMGEEATGPGSLASMFTGLHERLSDVFLDWTLEFDSAPAVTVLGATAVVVATGEGKLVVTDGERTSRYLLTAVLHHTEAGWRIWVYHGSEPQPW